MVSVLSKGGAAIAVEEDEDEVTGAAVPEGPAAPSSSGVAVGTVVETSSEATIGGPPLDGTHLHTLTRVCVCAGVAVPPCSDPCLHILQVQYTL